MYGQRRWSKSVFVHNMYSTTKGEYMLGTSVMKNYNQASGSMYLAVSMVR